MASASSTSPRVSVRGSFERSDDDYFPLTQSYPFFGFVIKVLRVPGVMGSVDDFFHASETSVREVILVTMKHLPTFSWYWALRTRKKDKAERRAKTDFTVQPRWSSKPKGWRAVVSLFRLTPLDQPLMISCRKDD
jgi:hypothetical protein